MLEARHDDHQLTCNKLSNGPSMKLTSVFQVKSKMQQKHFQSLTENGSRLTRLLTNDRKENLELDYCLAPKS